VQDRHADVRGQLAARRAHTLQVGAKHDKDAAADHEGFEEQAAALKALL
jgi:hypothetical protein